MDYPEFVKLVTTHSNAITQISNDLNNIEAVTKINLIKEAPQERDPRIVYFSYSGGDLDNDIKTMIKEKLTFQLFKSAQELKDVIHQFTSPKSEETNDSSVRTPATTG